MFRFVFCYLIKYHVKNDAQKGAYITAVHRILSLRSRPVQPFMWYGQLRQGFVCMRTTWSSINRVQNE